MAYLIFFNSQDFRLPKIYKNTEQYSPMIVLLKRLIPYTCPHIYYELWSECFMVGGLASGGREHYQSAAQQENACVPFLLSAPILLLASTLHPKRLELEGNGVSLANAQKLAFCGTQYIQTPQQVDLETNNQTKRHSPWPARFPFILKIA